MVNFNLKSFQKLIVATDEGTSPNLVLNKSGSRGSVGS